MTKLLLAILTCLIASTTFAQSNCVQLALEVAPQLSNETRRDFEAKLAQARESVAAKQNDIEQLIWLGRRTAYLGKYKEAIGIYTESIKKFPTDARLYRHRGHRFITLRCLDLAIADFEKAARLIRGHPDEIEPDGLPNARNIPTSTLQSNIWYHLGLAYYLRGDFRRALQAYRQGQQVSRNPDMLVANTHWLYMTLRRLGRENEATELVKAINDNLDIVENTDYYNLIRMYQGKSTAEALVATNDQTANTLSNATLNYGVGNWFLYNGRRSDAENVFRAVVAGTQWASFGYIAAEIELTRSLNKR